MLLALPPIMFTFDGFMFASSLQNESKKKSTFPTALVSGLILISVLYLFVAIGTMATASVPPAFTIAELTTGIGGGITDGAYTFTSNGIAYKVKLTGKEVEAINAVIGAGDTSKSYVLSAHQT